MTNTIYFFDTIREEWSASTSPNQTPRPSCVNAGDPTLVQQAASSSQGIRLNPNGEEWVPFNLKSFSFKELETATRKFTPDCVLGEAGFVKVYKGWIDGNTLTASTHPGRGLAVAVKRLNRHQQVLEGLPEVKYLQQLYHPNLVRLFGYSSDNEQNLLVYEFMPQGSLDYHLSEGSLPCLLSWSLRMKIALGVAKALAFLHTPQVNVIHCDIKSSHILLDSDYNAKLSGFWLAMDRQTTDESRVSTKIKGTYGYLAPEYFSTGSLNAKCDVYSFGVVLLELLSGQRAIYTSRPYREENLVEWTRPDLNDKKKILQFLDSHLNGQCARGDARKVATLAYRCLSHVPKHRPDMNEVAKALEKLQTCEYP